MITRRILAAALEKPNAEILFVGQTRHHARRIWEALVRVGGLIEAKANPMTLAVQFPNGSRVRFTHTDHAVDHLRGVELDAAYVDAPLGEAMDALAPALLNRGGRFLL